jgi:hypothetical protein
MSNDRKFRSVGGMGTVWNPKKDAAGINKKKALASDFLDGFYTGLKQNVGEHNADVVSITTDENQVFEVWCDTVLKKKMSEIRMGSYVRIQWTGYTLKKASEKKPKENLEKVDFFSTWEVGVDDSEKPLDIQAPAAQEVTQKEVPPAGHNQNDLAPAPKTPITEKFSSDSDLPFTLLIIFGIATTMASMF